MTKLKKDRKVSDTDRAFYKLGYQDGERQLKYTIKLLKTTHRVLFDELCRLDKTELKAGVLVSFKMVDQLIRNAKKGAVNYGLACRLEKLRDETKRQHSLLSTE